MSLQTREGANSEEGKKQAISAYCTLLEQKLEDDRHFREDSSKFCHNHVQSFIAQSLSRAARACLTRPCSLGQGVKGES